MPKRIGVTISSTLAMLLCMAFLSTSAHADDATDGITVSGTAKVMGKPNAVQIGAYVSGDAELTADAVVKYRDARKRAVAALEGLKIPTLSIESDGFTVKDWVDTAAQQQAMMRGQQVSNAKQKVSVGEQLRLVIKDADKMDQAALMDTMLKVLDTAKDAGLSIGDGAVKTQSYNPFYYYYGGMNQGDPSALIKFKVTDTAALRDEAYKQAMDNAKSKAQHLADLAGVKIGRILSVRDSSPQVLAAAAAAQMPQMAPQTARDDASELTSSVFADIPLTVSLSVQFEIEK
jgi:uncharacterized protein